MNIILAHLNHYQKTDRCPHCNTKLNVAQVQICPVCGNHVCRLSMKEIRKLNGLVYNGYMIRPQVYQSNGNKSEKKVWVASDYCIGILKGDLYTEKKYSHTPKYLESESSAIKTTLSIVKQMIYEGNIEF